MSYAILRTQKLKSAVAVHRSMKHAFRAQDTPNADLAKTPDNTHIGAQSVAEGMAAFRAELPEKMRKNAVQCVEYLVTASPEAMQTMSRKEQDAYFADSLDWLRARHGAENVVYAGIHRDETTPHMYAYVVPKDPDTGRLNCRRFLGGAKALSEMQTDFAERVGRQHGLQRGIKGSKAKHQRISQFYGQIERQEEHQHIEISADATQPQVLKKRLFSRLEEAPETVAARLTETVKEHYAPTVADASVAQQERRRAAEMAQTARSMSTALQAAQDRLKRLEGRFTAGLDATDLAHLAVEAKKLRQARQVDTERQRRIDALPGLVRRAAGAALTFAQRALAAIKEQAGNWRKVDWSRVDQDAYRESVQEHRQPPSKAMEAILVHSPSHADKTPEQVRALVEKARAHDPAEQMGQQPVERRGSRMSR